MFVSWLYVSFLSLYSTIFSWTWSLLKHICILSFKSRALASQLCIMFVLLLCSHLKCYVILLNQCYVLLEIITPNYLCFWDIVVFFEWIVFLFLSQFCIWRTHNFVVVVVGKFQHVVYFSSIEKYVFLFVMRFFGFVYFKMWFICCCLLKFRTLFLEVKR